MFEALGEEQFMKPWGCYQRARISIRLTLSMLILTSWYFTFSAVLSLLVLLHLTFIVLQLHSKILKTHLKILPNLSKTVYSIYSSSAHLLRPIHVLLGGKREAVSQREESFAPPAVLCSVLIVCSEKFMRHGKCGVYNIKRWRAPQPRLGSHWSQPESWRSASTHQPWARRFAAERWTAHQTNDNNTSNTEDWLQLFF